jgi:hypothetical protein
MHELFVPVVEQVPFVQEEVVYSRESMEKLGIIDALR